MFRVEICTPTKMLTYQANSISIPSENGEMMVMELHSNTVGSLISGEVLIACSDGSKVRHSVGGGSFMVGNGFCSIVSPSLDAV